MERRESSITKEEKDRSASPAPLLLPPPSLLASVDTFILFLYACPPPGTSPSLGPSSAFLLLLPRPGLVRKGPGQPRNLCG